MKKRLVSLLLAVSMLISMLTLGVSAAEETASGQCGDDVYWTLDAEGTLTVYGEGEMWDYPGITDEVGYDAITSIVIEEGVTYLGEGAFYDCDNLITVSIAASVEIIGSDCFWDCGSLKTVTIADESNLAEIYNYAFQDDVSLESINLPASLEYIGYYVFWNCSSLTDIGMTLDELADQAYIDYYAFYGCSGLADEDGFLIAGGELLGYYGDATEITIPDSVTYIGDYAIVNYTVEVIHIGASVESIEAGFYGCYALTEITVSEDNANYTSVDGVLFTSDMTTLVSYPMEKEGSSYTVPDGVETIAVSAFDGNANLETVILPDSVSLIDGWAFAWCYSLSCINVPENAELGSCVFICCSGLADEDGFVIVNGILFYYAGEGGDIVIPDTVTRIDMHAFNGNMTAALTSVVIPDTVESIGIYAFGFQDELVSVTIGDGVTDIESCAFYYCTSLSELTLGSSVTYIGGWAFEGAALTSLTIPASVEYIDEGAFYYCESLMEVIFESEDTEYAESAFEGVPCMTTYQLYMGWLEMDEEGNYWFDPNETGWTSWWSLNPCDDDNIVFFLGEWDDENDCFVSWELINPDDLTFDWPFEYETFDSLDDYSAASSEEEAYFVHVYSTYDDGAWYQDFIVSYTDEDGLYYALEGNTFLYGVALFTEDEYTYSNYAQYVYQGWQISYNEDSSENDYVFYLLADDCYSIEWVSVNEYEDYVTAEQREDGSWIITVDPAIFAANGYYSVALNLTYGVSYYYEEVNEDGEIEWTEEWGTEEWGCWYELYWDGWILGSSDLWNDGEGYYLSEEEEINNYRSAIYPIYGYDWAFYLYKMDTDGNVTERQLVNVSAGEGVSLVINDYDLAEYAENTEYYYAVSVEDWNETYSITYTDESGYTYAMTLVSNVNSLEWYSSMDFGNYEALAEGDGYNFLAVSEGNDTGTYVYLGSTDTDIFVPYLADDEGNCILAINADGNLSAASDDVEDEVVTYWAEYYDTYFSFELVEDGLKISLTDEAIASGFEGSVWVWIGWENEDGDTWDWGTWDWYFYPTQTLVWSETDLFAGDEVQTAYGHGIFTNYWEDEEDYTYISYEDAAGSVSTVLEMTEGESKEVYIYALYLSDDGWRLEEIADELNEDALLLSADGLTISSETAESASGVGILGLTTVTADEAGQYSISLESIDENTEIYINSLVVNVTEAETEIEAREDFTFPDDDGTSYWTWASEYIYACYYDGIISGYEDGEYKPGNSLTRAQAAKIIAEAFDLDLVDVDSYTDTFPDDTGTGNWTWAATYIYACVEAGIINGYEDGTYRLDNEVTRAELAKMIAIAAELDTETESTASAFADDTGTGNWTWAGTYIYACVDEGIINGYEEDDGTYTYRLDNSVNRAEAAKMIACACGLVTVE